MTLSETELLRQQNALLLQRIFVLSQRVRDLTAQLAARQPSTPPSVEVNP